MVLGNVERLEIVVSSFDFRAFNDRKAYRAENTIELFVSLSDKMLRAERAGDSGQREIESVARGSGLERGGFGEFFRFRGEVFENRAQPVQLLADPFFRIRRSGLQPVRGDARNDAVLAAEPPNAELLGSFRSGRSFRFACGEL